MPNRWPPQRAVKHALIDIGQTNVWLSEQTGISTVTIGGIVSGRVRATPTSRRLIAEALRRPVGELFTNIDDPAPDEDVGPDVWQTVPDFDDETLDRLRRLLFPNGYARGSDRAGAA
jgi:transcriptional regulator with XRE-family HTH domain